MKKAKALTELERDNLARVKANRERIKRECNAAGRKPDSGRLDTHPLGSFAERERRYLTQHPHLMKQKHCGLAPDTESRPTRRVVCPNGVVLHSAWYTVPTWANQPAAYKEQKYLWDLHLAKGRQLENA